LIEITEKYKCCGCKACYNICPVSCIEMVIDEEGFWYPKVDTLRCTQCGLCTQVCPELNVYACVKCAKEPVALAVRNKNDAKRLKSSSGGVFIALAEYVISNDGVVFGAGYDEDFNVIHKQATTLEELKQLMGSKYVQSDIGSTYEKAKGYLDNNKKVLFTGTPCQIAGLQNYLGNDYSNLYSCDLICHGVPSPKVFSKYKKFLEERYSSKIEMISFRDKDQGWNLFSMVVEFSNGQKYQANLQKDPFLVGFLRNLYLRPSCYRCPYSRLPRVSDITLGDYWGVQTRYPAIDNDKGVSLVLINTAKGEQLIEHCAENLEMSATDLEHAIQFNSCIVRPVSMPERRNTFFQDLTNEDFSVVVRKYMSPQSIWMRGINFFKRVVNHVGRKMRMPH